MLILMLRIDDVQDCSSLRRGRPSTHTIFGMAWTINSADYMFVAALNEVRKLDNSNSLAVFIGEFLTPITLWYLIKV